ncbi:hypothetical protein NPIL_62481 [Nephila pilipes]|uniref:Uncharacterized protein n=1 Tax=Nephila pilipes TaxID=299642 RepID=A0A8X6MW73_NEPPI|nr:hypothetical protein NPIL_62481 [Nephila pilipes]
MSLSDRNEIQKILFSCNGKSGIRNQDNLLMLQKQICIDLLPQKKVLPSVNLPPLMLNEICLENGIIETLNLVWESGDILGCEVFSIKFGTEADLLIPIKRFGWDLHREVGIWVLVTRRYKYVSNQGRHKWFWTRIKQTVGSSSRMEYQRDWYGWWSV